MADDTTIPPDAEEARILAEGIVETIRQPLLILAEDLSVHSANRAFYQAVQVDPAQTEGRLIYELGNNQWDIPGLRELLSHVLPQEETVEQFEVQHTFEDIGEKIMLVSARTLRRPGALRSRPAARCAQAGAGQGAGDPLRAPQRGAEARVSHR